MNEESRPKAAPERSGGPETIVPVDPVIAPWLASDPCECREAQLLRLIASGELPVPMTVGFKTLAGIVQAAAIRKLRQISHAFAGEPYTGKDDGTDHWHRVAAASSHEDLVVLRSTYEKPPRTPAQLMAEARHSWAKVEREIAPRHREAS